MKTMKSSIQRFIAKYVEKHECFKIDVKDYFQKLSKTFIFTMIRKLNVLEEEKYEK